MEKLHVKMSGENFLDAIDTASEALDREAMRKLEAIAFARRDPKWQAAVRHADNFIIACQRGNKDLQETCQAAFLKLVPEIRKS